MMKAKSRYLLTFLVLVPYILNAQVKQTGIQPFLNHQGLRHASVGICVKDLSGTKLAGHNEDLSLIHI